MSSDLLEPDDADPAEELADDVAIEDETLIDEDDEAGGDLGLTPPD